jgi:hypothetical protein
MILHLLPRLGLHIERRHKPQGVEEADHVGDIGAIFDVDAARQSSLARGNGGARLPNFTVPDHLK